MPVGEREFEVVLWGATGFTGRLVAEHLQQTYGSASLRWAIAGRDPRKLEDLAGSLGGAERPILIADAHDRASLDALVARARVVCSTVGPYARHGSELVAACAATGTDYCDLTGEVPWIRAMIDAHESTAQATGARLVTCCGFDSVPSDIGAFSVQREAQRRFGAPSPAIAMGVARISGGVSGGTVASGLDLFESAGTGARQAFFPDPYALNPPGRRGPEVRDQVAPAWDAAFGAWTAPFVMARINTRLVRRSAALLPEVYGGGFRYRETMLMGPGPAGAAKAYGLTAGIALAAGAMAVGPVRRAVAGWLPQSGEGPARTARERGSWELSFHGAAPEADAEPIRIRLRGEGDPGYASTSRMIGEAAVALAHDVEHLPGGFHTPASALGEPLVDRLQRNARIELSVESAPDPYWP